MSDDVKLVGSTTDQQTLINEGVATEQSQKMEFFFNTFNASAVVVTAPDNGWCVETITGTNLQNILHYMDTALCSVISSTADIVSSPSTSSVTLENVLTTGNDAKGYRILNLPTPASDGEPGTKSWILNTALATANAHMANMSNPHGVDFAQMTISSPTAGAIVSMNAGGYIQNSNKTFATTVTNTDATIPTCGAVYDYFLTLTGVLNYKGVWDASTGSYPSAPNTTGDYWKVSVAGTVGAINYSVNDAIIYNGTSWDKIDNTGISWPSDLLTTIEVAGIQSLSGSDPDYILTTGGSGDILVSSQTLQGLVDSINNISLSGDNAALSGALDVEIATRAAADTSLLNRITGLSGSISLASTFLGLTDTPSSYTGLSGYVPTINGAEDALAFLAPTTFGSTTFLGLTDTPSSFTANKLARVNAAGTAIEWTAEIVTALVGGTNIPTDLAVQNYVTPYVTSLSGQIYTEGTRVEDKFDALIDQDVSVGAAPILDGSNITGVTAAAAGSGSEVQFRDSVTGQNDSNTKFKVANESSFGSITEIGFVNLGVGLQDQAAIYLEASGAGWAGLSASSTDTSSTAVSSIIGRYTGGGTGSKYGGYFLSNGTGTSYGLYAGVTGAATTNYGIYATATGGSTNWAGYFNGNIFASGLADSYITTAISLGETGVAALSGWFDASSIIGGMNELSAEKLDSTYFDALSGVLDDEILARINGDSNLQTLMNAYVVSLSGQIQDKDTFLELNDTPSAYDNGKLLYSSATGIEFLARGVTDSLSGTTNLASDEGVVNYVAAQVISLSGALHADDIVLSGDIVTNSANIAGLSGVVAADLAALISEISTRSAADTVLTNNLAVVSGEVAALEAADIVTNGNLTGLSGTVTDHINTHPVPDFLIDLTPKSMNQPETNSAEVPTNGTTVNGWPYEVAWFDDTTSETLYGQIKMPPDLDTTSNFTVEVMGKPVTPAVSTVEMDFSYEVVSGDYLLSGGDVGGFTDIALSGNTDSTAEKMFAFSTATTCSSMGLQPDYLMRYKISRDVADTLVGDWGLLHLRLKAGR